MSLLGYPMDMSMSVGGTGMLWESGFGALYITRDFGRNWERLTPRHKWSNVIGASMAGDRTGAILTTACLFVTKDGGRTWVCRHRWR
jgi:photosystem II stability/assembly factor-like uncharacterized protein